MDKNMGRRMIKKSLEREQENRPAWVDLAILVGIVVMVVWVCYSSIG